MIDNIFIACGVVLVIYGFLGLVGTWLVPAIGNSRLLGSDMLIGRMQPNRVNRTIMSFWYLNIGAYVASSSSGHRTLYHVFSVAFVLCTVIVVVIRSRRSR
jgi:hypothetical protein